MGVTISLDEFQQFIDTIPLSFTRDQQGKEYVYNHVLDEEAEHILRVFSSVDVRSDESRVDGADAIRANIVDNEGNTLKRTPHTKRIETWDKNLRTKIQSLYSEYPDNLRECPECGAFLAVRSGQNGLFYGCTEYPECDHTENP